MSVNKTVAQINVLKIKNIDERDFRMICNLYYHPRATVKIGDEFSKEMEIKRGVRQGCILLPLITKNTE